MSDPAPIGARAGPPDSGGARAAGRRGPRRHGRDGGDEAHRPGHLDRHGEEVHEGRDSHLATRHAEGPAHGGDEEADRGGERPPTQPVRLEEGVLGLGEALDDHPDPDGEEV